MKSLVFKRAWELKRTTEKSFSECLKKAWDEVKKQAKIDKLINAGCKRWTKGNMDRLYINAGVIGYRWETYKTGNVKEAFNPDGYSISNCEMGRVLSAKAYIDINKDFRVVVDYRKGGYEDYVEEFVKSVC